MFLLQIAQAPFVFRVANGKGEPAFEVVVPKYTLQDAIQWGAAVKAGYEESIANGLDEKRAREVLALNPPIPPTLMDLKRLLKTPDGAEEVLTTQIPKAKIYHLVPADKKVNGKMQKVLARGQEVPHPQCEDIRKGILGIGPGPLCHIAWEIADVDDAQQIALDQCLPPESGDGDGEESEDVADPLHSSGGRK